MTDLSPEEEGTIAAVWIGGLCEGMFYKWQSGDRAGVADELLVMAGPGFVVGHSLLTLGALLRRLPEEDRVELGAMLSRRVLFGERRLGQ